MYDHIVGLIGRGHEIEVWCPQTSDRNYLPLSGLVKEHVVPLEGPDRHVEGSEFNPNPVKAQERITALDDHCRRCAKEMALYQADVLYAHPCKFIAVSPIARYVPCPTVIYLQEPLRFLHESIPSPQWAAIPKHPKNRPMWLAPNYLRWYVRDLKANLDRRLYVREEYDNACAFDYILVNSFFSRESMLRAYGLNSHVCYLGIDTDRFHPTSALRENFIVSLGALSPAKNPELIIKAVGHVSKDLRPDLYWITNFYRPEYEENLRTLARQLEVNFVPKTCISDDELSLLLGTAQAMVYAPTLEPFGYAPLEANACATAVVATAEGGVRETVKHEYNGLLCPPEPDKMGEAIERLIKNEALALRLGKYGRQAVEREWSFQESIDRIEYWLDRAMNASDRTATMI